MFERLKKSILDIIAQGKHEPRNPVNLEPNVQEGFANFSGQWAQGMGADFTHMINNMTGNTGATPPFATALDPTGATNSLVGAHPQQPQQPQPQHQHQHQHQHQQQAGTPHADMGQYQMWPPMNHTISNDMPNMDPMSGIFP